MSIVSSTHALGTIQRDGRRYVTEDHVDNIGKHWKFEYLAVANADYVAIRTARAISLAQQLIDNEIAAALLVDADPVLVYAAKADFAPVLREAYRGATQVECARLATIILNRIDSGWVTDTQIRNAFNLSAGQWTTLKAKMTTLRTEYNDLQAAAGE